jgi:hypothetical protein
MKPDINKVLELVLAEADTRRLNAGYAGAYGDGGATDLRKAVEYYRYGMTGELPPAWQPYADKARREADPEWAEYQRLQAKFEKK